MPSKPKGIRGQPYQLRRDEFFADDYLDGIERLLNRQTKRQAERGGRVSVSGKVAIEIVCYPVWDGDEVRSVMDLDEPANIARTRFEWDWIWNGEEVVITHRERN